MWAFASGLCFLENSSYGICQRISILKKRCHFTQEPYAGANLIFVNQINVNNLIDLICVSFVMKEIEYLHICFLVTFITFSGVLPIFLWGCLSFFIDLWTLFILRKLGYWLSYVLQTYFLNLHFFLSSAKDFNFHLFKPINCFIYLFATGLKKSFLKRKSPTLLAGM